VGGKYYDAFPEDNLFPDDDLWHHIAIAYDRQALRFRAYIDGEKLIDEPSLAWPESIAISGVSTVNQNFSFDFDDLAIWQGALSDSQAIKLFQDGRIDRIEESD
jgi:hypothetical protein